MGVRLLANNDANETVPPTCPEVTYSGVETPSNLGFSVLCPEKLGFDEKDGEPKSVRTM